MAGTALTMIFAFAFSGVMASTGMMDALVKPIVGKCKTVGSVILATAGISYGLNCFGSLSLSQVMTGTLCLRRRILSLRTFPDALRIMLHLEVRLYHGITIRCLFKIHCL